MELESNAPILFTIFNRPDHARQVLHAIRAAEPPRLYVAADGPRLERPGEAEKCEEARTVVELVDWDCEVRTLFRDTNLGCKDAMAGAITWFFEHEEAGIILEDDCVPDPSFFPFCDDLLQRYADDERIGMISGNNHFCLQSDPDTSYHFSRIGRTWGWATWARAWRKCELDPLLHGHALDKYRLTMGQTQRYREMFFSMIDRQIAGQISTWDVQWVLSLWAHQLLTIRPRVNLVANIGFGADSTHTRKQLSSAFGRTCSLEFPLAHPTAVAHDKDADRRYEKRLYPNSLPRRMTRRIGLRAIVQRVRQ